MMGTGMEQLEGRTQAENERLKRLMNRMYQGTWGFSPGQVDDSSTKQPAHLPLYISSILTGSLPFNERISSVLESLGRFAEVSRIYIFENFDQGQRMRNTFEWCNDGVAPHKDQLQDLAYNDFPEWKRLLTEEGMIKAADVRTLPASLHQILLQQNIEAILVLPLFVNDHFFGFIGFDECSFNREWFPHEVDLIKMASLLVSNAYQNHLIQQQVNEQSKHQSLLLEIAHLFNSSSTLDKQLQQTATLLSSHLQLSAFIIYENDRGNESCKRTFCEGRQELAPELLIYQKDLPGWLERFQQSGLYTSYSSILKYSNDAFSGITELDHLLAVPIRLHDFTFGFICFTRTKEIGEFTDQQTNICCTLADMLAGLYDRQRANLRLKTNNEQVLKINKELERKEQFLQDLLGSAPVGIMLIRDRAIEYVNKAFLTSSGYTQEEILKKHVSELYADGSENTELVDKFYKSIDKEGFGTIEVLLKNKSGLPSSIRILGKKLPDDGDGARFMLIGEDISQIRRAQRELLESEERNRKIIEASIDGVFILREDNELIYANAPGLEMFGYSFQELYDTQLEDIFASSIYYQRFTEALAQVKANNDYIGDVQLLHKNGDVIHAETYATNISLNGQLHYYFSLHNISKRKKHEAALVQSERKFSSLTENSPDHILRIKRTGTLSYCNQAFLKEYGLQPGQCIDKKLIDIDGLPQELVKGLNNAIGDVLLSASITPLELEFVYNGQMFAFDWTITPETNNELELSSLLLVGRNFTLRKRAEQELVIAKEKAESADRLKSAFLANMSHEIRTPLNAIVGFTNLLKEESISDAEKEEYIQIINNSSENLMELINDIVDLAKIESGELNIIMEPANPNKMLDALYQMFDKRMNLGAHKHLKFYLNLPDNSESLAVRCDLKRLNQVLTNLTGNAFKFTPKGFIEVGYTIEGHHLRFYVRDTGIGIHPSKQEIIFNPFRQEEETTSKMYGGTGLGLSISKRLISAMGGDLQLLSEKNKGSEFFFELPICELRTNIQETASKSFQPIIQKVQRIPLPDNVLWNDKMVLLIDATSTAQLQLRKFLDHTKITLISARTPNSARELLLKRNDIDLVLMDINMIGLSPKEFIQQIRQLGIDVPLIAQSVDVTEAERSEIIALGFDDVITKPVNKDDLLQKFNAALNSVSKPRLN